MSPARPPLPLVLKTGGLAPKPLLFFFFFKFSFTCQRVPSSHNSSYAAGQTDLHLRTVPDPGTQLAPPHHARRGWRGGQGLHRNQSSPAREQAQQTEWSYPSSHSGAQDQTGGWSPPSSRRGLSFPFPVPAPQGLNTRTTTRTSHTRILFAPVRGLARAGGRRPARGTCRRPLGTYSPGSWQEQKRPGTWRQGWRSPHLARLRAAAAARGFTR